MVRKGRAEKRMSDTPPPVGFNIWLAPTKPNHSVTNIRCWGKFWGEYKAKDKTARIFQCARPGHPVPVQQVVRLG